MGGGHHYTSPNLCTTRGKGKVEFSEFPKGYQHNAGY